MHPKLPTTLVLALLLSAGADVQGAAGQILFDWPVRAAPQPEVLLTGAAAVLWNPGGMPRAAGGAREAWVVHVDGPDATGVRGLAAAATMELPLRIRLGIGYRHLGIPDIPRTTTSPERDGPGIDVAEDAAILAVARDLNAPGGIGASLRYVRAVVGDEVRSRLQGAVGFLFLTTLPLRPRFGLQVRGIGTDMSLLAGVEAIPPALPRGRLPLYVGYGLTAGLRPAGLEHRISLRTLVWGWLDVGVGAHRFGNGNGWAALWTAGATVGPYSVAVLREGLANDFGPVHYFRLTIRLD